ncbi:glutamate-5-semialdehyde dehydrogenase [Aeromicrobium sp. REDSEA-S32_B7]|uniref:glutamate-5-semialdehyde dehydrogenase n=1 Tax=Aeromicrobium sp. REDSEA-S32_B7 TaxID=1811526 RepID=UPI000B07F5F8|nr:glutamate-5-semialdehyde dehydrogenase [Aeromicrobium sp. REDSEA-S32_B7]
MKDQVHELARRARTAARSLALASRAQKDAALLATADALEAATERVVAANALDVEAARAEGTPENVVDRLLLDPDRVAAFAQGVRDVAALPDPVGEVVRGSTLPNGLRLEQVRVPMGVIGMIYEGRPNVTADAAAICLKAGSASLLRGSRSAARSNAAIVDVMREAIAAAGLPADVRARVHGVAVHACSTSTTVPVIETGTGNVHVYVDADADLDMALDVVLNAKTHRTSVCNAAESLLVHRDVAEDFLPRVTKALQAAGVTIHGDASFAAVAPGVLEASDHDWATEYLSLDIAAKVVDSLEDAVEHIRTWSSGHTEAIVTRSIDAARRFTLGVDSAAVMVNASTRFTDGGEFGFGAEIGISTQKLHARGPMGLPEMTTTTYVVTGDGHVR